MSKETVQINNEFAKDLIQGLSARNKSIPDKYYYDNIGSVYFQKLMAEVDYYPTTSEMEIFHLNKSSIAKHICLNEENNIIELGAGDGLKTKILLQELYTKATKISYYPIDYSEKYTVDIENTFKELFPLIHVKGINEDYFDGLEIVKNLPNKILLFLGSTIGSFSFDEALIFMKAIRANLTFGDKILLGFDLKKDPEIIYRAYDKTCEPWCNYFLERINNEFGADIDIGKFKYNLNYNPGNGELLWHFISLNDQIINFEMLDLKVRLNEWEPILVGRSKKFDILEIEELANQSGFKIIEHYRDKKNYYCNSLWGIK